MPEDDPVLEIVGTVPIVTTDTLANTLNDDVPRVSVVYDSSLVLWLQGLLNRCLPFVTMDRNLHEEIASVLLIRPNG